MIIKKQIQKKMICMNKILLNQILHTLMSYEDSSETIKVNDDNLNENKLIITETPPKPNELDIKPVLHRSKRKRRPPDRLDL